MTKRKNLHKLQKDIFDYLSTIYAGEIVLPKPHVKYCYTDSPVSEVLLKFRKYKYSRLLVVERENEKFVGYIFYKDFFDKYIDTNGSFEIAQVVRDVTFVPESMSALDIIETMKKKITNIVVVVDEYGNHIGILTLEDIIEKILGEILDESDSRDDEEVEIKKISEDEYLVNAWAPIDQVAFEIGMKIEKDVYENMDVRTVSGFLMYITGSILKYGNIYEYGDFIFKVIEIENNRPSKILIKRKV
ncbi:MAG: CBS domain-containing protein [Brevinematia bacterium]